MELLNNGDIDSQRFINFNFRPIWNVVHLGLLNDALNSVTVMKSKGVELNRRAIDQSNLCIDVVIKVGIGSSHKILVEESMLVLEAVSRGFVAVTAILALPFEDIGLVLLGPQGGLPEETQPSW